MVVGAGVVGCAVAYELARRGASVEIIDDRGTGLGATQASAGMLAPFNEAPDGGPLFEIALRGLAAYDDFVAALAADIGQPLNYHRNGSFDVALEAASVSRLRDTAERLLASGLSVEWLEPAAVRARVPAFGAVHAGLFIPGQGFVGVAEFTRTLAAAARRHGAKIIEHGRVRRIAGGPGELSLVTDRGSLSADAVVIAAGSWSGAIDIEGATARVPVTPIRGQLVQLHWTAPPLSHVVWSERCYVVPWHDGTVLVGATVEDAGFDERTTAAGVRALLEAATALLPSAADAGFVAARAGLRPASPDHLPIVGRSAAQSQVVYATGHYRNGVLLAPLTAQLVADLVLDERADPMLDLMSPARFGGL